jgi:hypothetical protein
MSFLQNDAVVGTTMVRCTSGKETSPPVLRHGAREVDVVVTCESAMDLKEEAT